MGKKTELDRRPIVVGSLYDDVASLAGQVQQSIRDSDITVWADDRCQVFACGSQWAPTLPSHWVAGTYSFGYSHQDIQEDLRALLRERSKDWMIDEATEPSVV